jgi:cyclopropane fatty-acyl-phospholipid synthase-like methyltransferase
MDAIQEYQSKEYEFPYHYIPAIKNDSFSSGRWWSFSLSYVVALRLIIDHFNNSHTAQHVDIGCGDGALLFHLRREFPKMELHGIDYDPNPLNWARLFNDINVRFEAKNIIYDTIGERFESASLIEVLEHIPLDNVSVFLEAVRRCLKSKGTLIVTVPHKNNPLLEKHYQHFTFKTLAAALSEWFEVVSMFGFEYNFLLERILKSLTIRPGFVVDSHFLNKKRLNWQLSAVRKNLSEKGAARIFCVCQPK